MAESKVNKRKNKTLFIPKEDTHPGPGLQELDGEVEGLDARDMLGKDD